MFGFHTNFRLGPENQFGFGGNGTAFDPANIAGGQMYLFPPSGINTKTAANFVAANSESLSSTSSSLKPGDSDFSLGCWARVTSLATNNALMSVFETTGNQRSYTFQIRTDGTYRGILSADGSSTTTFDWSSTLSINTWYFLIFSYDSVNDVLKLSVNGASFQITAHSGGGYASSTSEFSLGSQNNVVNFVDGQIDNAFFYDKALTLSEIQELYNSGDGVEYSDLADLAGTYAIAQSFDGSSDAFNLDTLETNLAATTTGTWAGWVKVTDTTASLNICGFGDTNANERILMFHSTTLLRVECFDAGVLQWRLSTDGAAFSDGVYVHVAVVHNGTQPTVYVNGSAVAQSFVADVDRTKWFSDLAGLDNGRLGCSNSNSLGNTGFFEGELDGWGFWTDAKDATFISDLYNSGSGLAYSGLSTDQKTNLECWYDLNDIEGANQQDSTANSNDATVIGTPVQAIGGKGIDTTVTAGDLETSIVSWWDLNELSGNRADSVTASSNTLTDNNTVGATTGKVTETAAENDQIYQALDQFASANNAIQDTFADQPLFASNIIRLDGSSTNLNINEVLTDISSDSVGTVALWAKPDSASPAGAQMFFSFANSSANTKYNAYIDSSGLLHALVRQAGNPRVDAVSDSSPFSDATWVHLTFVQDGVAMKMYVDGSEIDITDTGNAPDEYLGNLTGLNNGRIGCDNSNGAGNSFFFDGDIQQFLIYNVALTAGQISLLSNYNPPS